MSMLGKWGSRAKESVLAMRYSGLSDKKWFETIAASLSDASLGLPGFPSPQVQANFTGRSGRPALEEAFEFYTLIKSSVPTLTGPILDFGCGWGRILRFFLKDLDPKYVHGVDVEPSAIAECRDTKVPGDIQLIAPHGPLPFSKDTFQIVYAYSVFTHLPEQAAAHWMREIKRILKPGRANCVHRADSPVSQAMHRIPGLPAVYMATSDGKRISKPGASSRNVRERKVHLYGGVAKGLGKAHRRRISPDVRRLWLGRSFTEHYA